MQELVRITQKRYREVLEICRFIEDRTDSGEEGDFPYAFPDRRNIPAAAELKGRNLEEKIRQIYPYLIYYRDVYKPEPGDENYSELREYFNRILTDWLDIIEDSDMDPVEEMTPGQWKQLSLEEKCLIFGNLLSYYSPYEFDTFIRDLGWKKFMGAYEGIKEKEKYAENEKLLDDLEKIWEAVQVKQHYHG